MEHHRISRRTFLCSAFAATVAHPYPRAGAQAGATRSIETVQGTIPKDAFGMALPHEHIMCDFIGADATGHHRWNEDEVFKRMLPYVETLKQAGISTFFDCTPAYIGRDPEVLKRLSMATGLNIVTNTGFYGGANDKYVPMQAYDMSVEDMAAHWIHEREQGIGTTGIRPGFIKIGVDAIANEATPLSHIDAKIVRAAAMTSSKTQLSVTCHTGGGDAGLAALRMFIEHGGAASRFMVAHADNHGLLHNQKVADLGGWVSFDAIGRRPLKQHLELVPAMMAHRADRLLLSQDNGWYSVGEPNGGEVRAYTDLTDTFLPALKKAGIHQHQIDTLIHTNPWNAFAI